MTVDVEIVQTRNLYEQDNYLAADLWSGSTMLLTAFAFTEKEKHQIHNWMHRFVRRKQLPVWSCTLRCFC